MAQLFTTCKTCGQRFDLDLYRKHSTTIVSKMRREHRCFDCVAWQEVIDNPDPNTIIIDGKLYSLTEPLQELTYREAKKEDAICLFDLENQIPVATYFPLLHGEIPERFREQLPTQYITISKEQYKKLLDFEAGHCRSKGCFDRYHCHWYCAELAEPNGPWNKVPINHKIGSENCPSFINKHELSNSH